MLLELEYVLPRGRKTYLFFEGQAFDSAAIIKVQIHTFSAVHAVCMVMHVHLLFIYTLYSLYIYIYTHTHMVCDAGFAAHSDPPQGHAAVFSVLEACVFQVRGRFSKACIFCETIPPRLVQKLHGPPRFLLRNFIQVTIIIQKP